MNDEQRPNDEVVPPRGYPEPENPALPIDPEQTEKSADEVEEASDDSFPASDPPSFTGSTAAD